MVTHNEVIYGGDYVKAEIKKALELQKAEYDSKIEILEEKLRVAEMALQQTESLRDSDMAHRQRVETLSSDG